MRVRTTLPLVVSLLVALTGCDDGGTGSDDDTGSASATGSSSATGTGSSSASGSGTGAAPVELDGEVQDHGTAELTGTTLELEADDFYFEPTFIRAEPGTEVEVAIHNEGDAPHTFTIDGTDIDVEIPTGEAATATVTVPDDGSLNFICRFHIQQGMQGAFFTG